jgi:hypothetical protein
MNAMMQEKESEVCEKRMVLEGWFDLLEDKLSGRWTTIKYPSCLFIHSNRKHVIILTDELYSYDMYEKYGRLRSAHRSQALRVYHYSAFLCKIDVFVVQRLSCYVFVRTLTSFLFSYCFNHLLLSLKVLKFIVTVQSCHLSLKALYE